MPEYYMPAARCLNTQQLLKKQDLRGRRFSVREREEAWLTAEILAEDLTARTRESWVPELITYTA